MFEGGDEGFLKPRKTLATGAISIEISVWPGQAVQVLAVLRRPDNNLAVTRMAGS